MANLKRFTQGYTTGGNNPNICIQRDADAFFWNGTAFVANGGAPYVIAMTEKYEGFWEYETSAAVWDNGLINVTIYDAASSTSAVLSAYSQFINADTQIGFIEASATTAKNAVSSIKQYLEPFFAALTKQGDDLGVLSDRIDSFHQVLSRRSNGDTV